LGDDSCINPKRGSEIGTTWQKRFESLKEFKDGFE
jgi:hypothetical protein